MIAWSEKNFLLGTACYKTHAPVRVASAVCSKTFSGTLSIPITKLLNLKILTFLLKWSSWNGSYLPSWCSSQLQHETAKVGTCKIKKNRFHCISSLKVDTWEGRLVIYHENYLSKPSLETLLEYKTIFYEDSVLQTPIYLEAHIKAVIFPSALSGWPKHKVKYVLAKCPSVLSYHYPYQSCRFISVYYFLTTFAILSVEHHKISHVSIKASKQCYLWKEEISHLSFS